MNDLNYIFFEKFKKLDKLCGEIYESTSGVTHYIDDMKATSWENYRHILNWKTDLNELIRLRHIRNYLAHTEGAFQEDICTQNDIKLIENYYQRIMSQSDPLAMLNKTFQTRKQMQETDYSGHALDSKIYDKKDEEPYIAYLILALIGLVVIMLLIFFVILNTI